MAVLVVAGAAIGECAIVGRPELTRNGAFLFGDQGYSLFVAAQLRGGARLYRDVAYPYGSLGPYLYVALSRVFGNTPLVYLQFLLAASVVNLGLAYALLRRAASPGVALFVALAGILPLLIVPGALLGGYTSAFYIPIERMMLLGAALAWRPPAERSADRAAALGAVLGLGQAMRFGPPLICLAVVMLFDVALVITRRGASKATWLRSTLIMLGVFAVVQALLVATSFATLPRPVAIDVVWPRFMLGAFAPLMSRWSGLPGWRVTVGQYFNPIIAGVLTAAGAVWYARKRDMPDTALVAFMPPVIFVAAAFTLFHTEHHFRQFCWMLPFGCAPVLNRHAWTRAAALVCWAPLCFLTLTSAAPKHASNSVLLTCPNGWQLTVSATEKTTIESIVSALQTVADRAGGGPVLFYPAGPGFYVAYGIPHVSRDTWFFAGSIRPYDIESLVVAYHQLAGLVVCRDDPEHTGPDGPLFRASFPPLLRDGIEARIAEPVWRDSECAVFRLREPE